MYIERKEEWLNGPARIGRVRWSKTGRSIEYVGRRYIRTTQISKANYIDQETGEAYWISGPRRDGSDRLYPASTRPVEIDDDVREEY
ncbi:MAG: hypothetical protein KIT16_13275, partial [Rhodospirillaceae bacterium]|nr:hypothetical protein [Rhodospirillaceae bacterium]